MEPDDDKEPLDFSEFEGKTIGEILEEGRKVLLMRLVLLVRNNQASHQEQAILRNMLKDNGLVLGLPQDGERKPSEVSPPMDLPDFEEPEYNRLQ